MEQENINQEQQNNVIGGNIQDGVPQPQDDPALVINQHYLPRGDLTITSNISYVDSSVTPITIPFVRIPTLFQQTFDNTETNFTTTDEMNFPTNQFSPAPHVQMPNIARYLGYVILGIELDTKYLEGIMICCQNYLDGTMEILPNGTFRYLNQRRDGLSRRYSRLCLAVYYAISSVYYATRPRALEIVKEMQSLMQDLYDNTTYTSVYTKLIPYVVDGQEYNVSRSTLRRWATTIPWHALMYNSQSPFTFDEFMDLFFKIYSIAQGKALRYDMSHPNVQRVHTIIPNSDLFVKLTPPGMVSSQVHITSDIPQRFILLIRYLYLAENNSLSWRDDTSSDDENSENESEGTENMPDAESIDEAELAY